ncbi:MAG: helix-turn-helix transcriptional regulator [Brachymonas sp.]|nr:helix-turn-helix transcriptional regulator [Brachymonas sp.]
MAFQADFSDAVRSVRKRMGWSQTQLAQASGVHLNTVSLLERGEADVRMSTMLALSTALNLSLHVQAAITPANSSVEEPQETALPAFLRQSSS